MMEQAIFTNLCMVRDGDRVLVQLRSKADDYAGLTFPGGHVEPGESFTDAVIREVREETGLTIASPRLCGVKDWYDTDHRYVVLLYAAERFSGTLRGSDEGEVWWEPIEMLADHPLATSDLGELLRIYADDGLSEFFYWKDEDGWQQVLK